MSKSIIELMSDEDFAAWMGEDKPDESIGGTPLGEGGIPVTSPEEKK